MDATYSQVAVPRSVHPTNVGSEFNLAERYPADGAYWQDFEAVSVREAVLLSLGIEPPDIRDPNDVSGGISNVQQGREYLRRTAVLRNAIAAKVLAKAVMDDPACPDHVGFKGFVAWAAGKRWSMPEWMLGINAPQAKAATSQSPVAPSERSGIRERKKAEKQAEYRRWRAMYDQLFADNPKMVPSKAIKCVAEKFGKEFKTISNHIRRPPKPARNKVARSGKTDR